MSDNSPERKRFGKRGIIAGLILILLVLFSQAVSFATRHNSASLQKRITEWGRLRCLDHGHEWVASDKTFSAEGSCH